MRVMARDWLRLSSSADRAGLASGYFLRALRAARGAVFGFRWTNSTPLSTIKEGFFITLLSSRATDE
jgi:hypothetical protein